MMAASPASTTLDSIEGIVVERGGNEKEQYETLRKRNFARDVSPHEPAVICEVATIQDIQTCLAYARENDMEVSIRSGGHNWFGCYLRPNKSLLIDTKRLNSIEVKGTTAIVGPSVMGQAINEAAASHGLCFPTGHCCGVPIGGFLLGGGFGWFTEHFGMSAESILGMTVITSQGKMVEVTGHNDWMWLARGAGCTFPGVVVSFTLQLHALPPIVRNRTSFHPMEDAAKIIQFLIDGRKEERISKKVETTVILASTPPPLANHIPTANKICIVSISLLADDETEFANHKSTVLDALPSTPHMPYDVAGNYSFAELPNLAAGAYPPHHCWTVRSYMLDQDNANIDWNEIQATFSDKAPLGVSHTLIVIGTKSQSENPSAYGNMPTSGIMLGSYGAYSDSHEEVAVSQFTNALAAIVQPITWKYNILEHPCNKETFPNMFLDGSAEKLQTLRRQYDPNGLFFDPSKVDA